MAEIVSSPSSPVAVVPQPTSAWLKDPLFPTRNVALSCVGTIEWTRPREQTSLTPLGRADPIVQTGVRRLRTGTLALTVLSQAELDAVDALLNPRPDGTLATLLYQGLAPAGWRGDNVYAIPGDDTSAPVGQAPTGARDLSIPVTEVLRPA